MSARQVYLNGQLVGAEQATVSVFDAGLLHGASAFTTMLAHNGVIFRLQRHLDRLMETVELLGLRTEATSQSLTDAAYQVLAANGLREARMRITLTPGSVRGGKPTTIISADELAPYPPQWYEKGLSVVVSSFKQYPGDPTFGHKTGCYLTRMLAMQEAAAKGAEEALWFTHDNRLAESCFRNVFLVLEGKVYTPPRDTPVLPGVVRGAVIELCGQLGIECRDDQTLTVHEMLAATEVFLTGSTVGVVPVARIERHAVGDERPGPVTLKLLAAYRQLLDRECQPHAGQ